MSSWMPHPDNSPLPPLLLLKQTLFYILHVSWDQQLEILIQWFRTAGESHDQAKCPPGLLYVPPSARSDIFQWRHVSKVACYPGVNHTIGLFQQHFRQPSMMSDTKELVVACSVYHSPAGLLKTLSILHYP